MIRLDWIVQSMGTNRSGAVFLPLSGDQTCFANRTEIPIMKGLAVQGRAKPEMVIVRRRAKPRMVKSPGNGLVHGWPGRGSSYARRSAPEHEAAVFVMPGVLPATLWVLFGARAS